jgi:hypothetical protein
MPNWYLAGCAATSHYRDTEAVIAWAGSDTIVVMHTDDPQFWGADSAPFHKAPCDHLTVTFKKKSS